MAVDRLEQLREPLFVHVQPASVTQTRRPVPAGSSFAVRLLPAAPLPARLG
jgi:hypothetical protein